MAKSTIEDYLKAMLQLTMESETANVMTGILAKRVGVSNGSASTMVRNLSEQGLVAFTSYKGAQLTKKGYSLAIRVVRTHRLIELFLATALKMDWDEVHEEAERLEHAVSERLLARIDEFLRYPDTDPHGDPIPHADGSLPVVPCISLAGCDAGSAFVIKRILDQSSNTLHYLSSAGVRLSQHGRVIVNSPLAEIVSIELAGKVISLNRTLAANVLVSVKR